MHIEIMVTGNSDCSTRFPEGIPHWSTLQPSNSLPYLISSRRACKLSPNAHSLLPLKNRIPSLPSLLESLLPSLLCSDVDLWLKFQYSGGEGKWCVQLPGHAHKRSCLSSASLSHRLTKMQEQWAVFSQHLSRTWAMKEQARRSPSL